jgi:hypothetical protein
MDLTIDLSKRAAYYNQSDTNMMLALRAPAWCGCVCVSVTRMMMMMMMVMMLDTQPSDCK